MLFLPREHSISAGTPGRRSPSDNSRSLFCPSSIRTSLDPGAPLQYRSRTSDVTSKPRPKAWIALRSVEVKASELDTLKFSPFRFSIRHAQKEINKNKIKPNPRLNLGRRWWWRWWLQTRLGFVGKKRVFRAFDFSLPPTPLLVLTPIIVETAFEIFFYFVCLSFFSFFFFSSCVWYQEDSLVDWSFFLCC